MRRKRGYWEDAVWSVGLETHALGPEGRWDVGLRWTHAGPLPHTHHQFPSGLTLDDRTLGDPLGPNAASVGGYVSWAGTASTARVRATATWERYSGDEWRVGPIPGAGRWDWDWTRIADNPDEVRRRVELEYLRLPGAERWETSLRLGYEHVERFDFTDQTRHNLLAQVTARYAW